MPKRAKRSNALVEISCHLSLRLEMQHTLGGGGGAFRLAYQSCSLVPISTRAPISKRKMSWMWAKSS